MMFAGKHIRIKSHPRFIAFIAVILLAVFMGISLFSGAFKASGEDLDTGYIAVEISAGDSLWDIAGEYMSGSGSDIRHDIYLLEKINGLDSSGVSVGQTIKIPVNNTRQMTRDQF